MCRLDKILVHHSLQCREEVRQSNKVPSFHHGASGNIRFGKYVAECLMHHSIRH